MNALPIILSLLIFVPGLTTGQEISPVQGVEHFVIAGGEKLKTGQETHFMARFDKSQISRVNEARKLTGLPAVTIDTVHADANLNREFLQTYLTLLRGEFSQAHGKEPTREQIFLLWKLGDKAFKKIAYDPEKVKDRELKLRLEHFRTLFSPQSKIPPPLPTDGRRPMPRRYQARHELQASQPEQTSVREVPPEINVPKPKN